MKLYLLLTTLSCFFLTAAFPQRGCLSEQYGQAHVGVVAGKGEPASSVPPRDTVANEIITIPVVVHVLFNNSAQNISDQQINSQIEVLNKDYRLLNADKVNVPAVFKPFVADARIMFCLAKVSPEGRPTTGIDRRYTTAATFMADDAMKSSATGGVAPWDPSSYLNIWVCNIFGRTIGYATAPGSDPLKDGVVIKYDAFGTTGNLRPEYNLGRTATHEIGHWLGLKHIWGDDLCGNDGIDDTPRQKSYNSDCPVFPATTDCSQTPNGDMFMNFMDLTSDACVNMFTNGQKQKMRAQFAIKGYRNSFLRSYQCDSTLASGAPLPQDSLPVSIQDDPIRMYPNPAQGEVTIEAEHLQTLQQKRLIILTPAGVVMRQQVLSSNKERISLQGLLPGVYFIKIGEGKSTRTLKLIKI